MGWKKGSLILSYRVWVITKKETGTIVDFNKRFNKVYNKIPIDIKPSQAAAKVNYAGAFEEDFTIMLRERRSSTLLIMQNDAIDIGGNMTTSGKIKVKIEQTDKYRKN